MLHVFLLAALAASPAQAVEIPHESYTLDNGLEVVLIPDRTLPRAVVSVWYDVGSYDDPQGRSGFAHLFEHLMFKGTSRVAEGEFDTFMEQAGGWNNATTADYRTNYYDVAPSSALDLLLWLESDRMTSLDITQKKLDVEREVVRNERRQNYEDRPYGGMWLALPPLLYPADNPLHRSGIGTHAELNASSVEDVRSFYETWYVPSNAVLAVAGDFDVAELKPRIEQLFGALKTAPKPVRELAPLPDAPTAPSIELTDKVSLPMTMTIWHSPRAFAPGDAELDVLSHLLAGSDDSRLTRRLVHEERLAQGVDAAQWSGRWDSQYEIDAMGVPGADLAAIEGIIREELDALVGERPPTAEEIRKAVNKIELDLLRSVETVHGRAEALQRYRMFTGEYDGLEADLARYRAVTPESVAAQVARLTAERSAVVHIVPEAK